MTGLRTPVFVCMGCWRYVVGMAGPVARTYRLLPATTTYYHACLLAMQTRIAPSLRTPPPPPTTCRATYHLPPPATACRPACHLYHCGSCTACLHHLRFARPTAYSFASYRPHLPLPPTAFYHSLTDTMPPLRGSTPAPPRTTMDHSTCRCHCRSMRATTTTYLPPPGQVATTSTTTDFYTRATASTAGPHLPTGFCLPFFRNGANSAAAWHGTRTLYARTHR